MILLVIILLYIIFYKYKTINTISDTFVDKIRKTGIKVNIPQTIPELTLVCGEYKTISHSIASIIYFAIEKKFKLNVFTDRNSILDDINNNKFDLGICYESELVDYNMMNEKHSLNFVCSLNREYLFFIVKNNNTIFSIRNMKGKIIGIQHKNSYAFTVLKILCESYDLGEPQILGDFSANTTLEDKIYVIEADINTNCNLFYNNHIEALFYFSGLNNPYIRSLSSKTNIKFIEFNQTEDDILGTVLKNKDLDIENYKTKNKNIYINSYYTRNILICNDTLTTDAIYYTVSQIFKNTSIIKTELSKIGQKELNSTSNYFNDDFNKLAMSYIDYRINIHRGAYRYYREIKIINNDKHNCEFNNKCIITPFNQIEDYWKYDVKTLV